MGRVFFFCVSRIISLFFQANFPSLPPPGRPLVYPRFGKQKAEINYEDRGRLRDNEFLNDNLIGFYIRFLEDHLARTNPELAKKIYFFNSYFFAALMNIPKGQRVINYKAVQNWTRRVDIFSYDYVVVPINESAHWYVAIICNLRGLLPSQQEDKSPETSRGERGSSMQIEEQVNEVPETPELTISEAPGEGSTTGPDHSSLSGKDEVARKPFAFMNLTEDEGSGGPGKKEEHLATNEEWPEDGENQKPTPTTFLRTRSSTRRGSSREQFDVKSPSEIQREKKKAKNADPSRPTIITFDSLDMSRQPTIRALKDYLHEEAKSKRATEIDTSLIRGIKARGIPLQHNYSDCGLYLLAYIEKFVQNPNDLIGKLLIREPSSSIEWPILQSHLLRRRLRTFLDDLYDEQERIGQDKALDKETLADRRQICFLLGAPDSDEYNEVDGSEKKSSAEVQETGSSNFKENGSNDG